jgi:hypothetical protein
MKKILTSFFVFFFCIASIAQVPGYLGKRFSVGYSNYFFPRSTLVSSSFTFGDEDKTSTRMAFNSTHSLDVDYVLTPWVSACLAGQFSKMDVVKQGGEFNVERGGTYNTVQYLPGSKEDMQLNTINLSVAFKFFKERYMNPYGKYRKLEVMLMMNTIKMDENGFYSVRYDPPKPKQVLPYPVAGERYKFNSLILAYTIGKQRVLFDKLVLDWGIRFGINYNYISKSVNPLEMMFADRTSAYEEDSIEKKLKEQAIARTMGAQLVNAHVGLRFLAF